VVILLSYFEHTEDQEFAREVLLPIADAVTEFFDLHYPRDSNGRIRFEPAQALETWHWAVNPLPEIAGLTYLCQRLLDTTEPVRLDELHPCGTGLVQRCRRLLRELPPLPTGLRNGKSVVLPAERFDIKKNTENPELYCVFPYRLYGIGKPGLELARDTFAARLHVEHTCWHQDVIQMACLGLAEDARQSLIHRASPDCHNGSRFPGFWNEFHDEVPDVDHGGVLQIALQMMLLQCDGRVIRLLPAWPRGWNADFKLHAPLRTVVSGSVRNGKIEDLRVTPSNRAKDVIVSEPFD
ncbi:MAG: hypothetical protein NZ561_06380, partial [Phycisphaerae bacterium]|nr:hypothetical protein [Phycisphaerae bacterium]MDW8263402.1 hypothetical protein [Phycisphaerales bacterium]